MNPFVRVENFSDEERAHGKRELVLGLALVIGVLLVYQPVWNGKPIWDDAAHLIGAALRSWTGLERIWFQPGATQQYYPLVYSVFWLGAKLSPDTFSGYHLLNILLHAASALMIVRILRRLDVPGAWLAAALWAFHPVQVESVAWMSELKNTLSGLCYFGSALAYLRFDQEKKGTFYVASFGLFALGLLAKSVIATLPGALLLVFWWKRKTLRWKEDILPLVPFFVVGGGLGMFTAWLERTMLIGMDRQAVTLSITERFLIPGRAVWFYLGKLAWPHPLIFMYPRWEVNGAVWWQFLFPLATLLLAAALSCFRRSLGSGPLVALLFFVGTLFPALGFLDIYPFRYSFVADHFQYLACLGPLALAGAGIEHVLNWASKQSPPLKPIACLGLLGILGILSWIQCAPYADIETLWRTTLAKNPASWMAYDNLGHVLQQKGQLAEAIAQFRKSVEIRPDIAEGHIALGTALLDQGTLPEAVAQYRTALNIQPDSEKAHYDLANALIKQGNVVDAIAQYQIALRLRPKDLNAHVNLGNALAKQGRMDEAIVQYREALRIAPDDVLLNRNFAGLLLLKGDLDGAMVYLQKADPTNLDPAQRWYSLGNELLATGDWEHAIACYRKSLSVQPRFADAQAKLGQALFNKGETRQAIDSWEQALAIKPDLIVVRNQLAWLLATSPDGSLRNGAKAVALAEQANQLTEGRNPVIIGTLAAAYAETGRFDEATETGLKALNLAKAQNNGGLAGALQEEIDQFKAGLPIRDTK